MVPSWKIWLSHLWPVVLHRCGSAHNPVLTVRLTKGRLQLLSGTAVYSWDDLYHNFLMAFMHLHADEQPWERVLVLGLGLGSVPYLLEKIFGCRCQYTAVEIDPTVADLARRYALPRMQSPITIAVADATAFVAQCTETYDLIAVDIFNDQLVPATVETEAFLLDCRRLLSPGGILMYNRLYDTPEHRERTDSFFERAFRTVFPQGSALDVRYNRMLLSVTPPR
jgi:spermidine synthase